jgi:hypothetical protein
LPCLPGASTVAISALVAFPPGPSALPCRASQGSCDQGALVDLPPAPSARAASQARTSCARAVRFPLATFCMWMDPAREAAIQAERLLSRDSEPSVKQGLTDDLLHRSYGSKFLDIVEEQLLVDMEDLRHNCLKVQRWLFYLVVPLSVCMSAFACFYSWIYTNTSLYFNDDDKAHSHTPVSDSEWQACIGELAPGGSWIAVPLAMPTVSVADGGAAPAVYTQYDETQNFAISASTFGGQMFIFLGLGLKSGYLGLHGRSVGGGARRPHGG